ncbi:MULTISPECIES: hypothetical protein, partial [Streptomyces]|uniref:hypothetical protein n=1 Tax=Streptomyces TaxID=1883 RepID=UPI0022492DBE
VARTRTESARTIAENAMPEVRQAIEVTQVPGEVSTGDIVHGHGTVHIALRSTEAYDLARWVRNHYTQEEIAAYARGAGS